MNIRKAVDYSTMFATLESVMKADLPQMELYCEIGKAVCAHSEKGAAVAAAELRFSSSFDAELFGELVEKIIIESNDSVRFCLKNGLELGESIERTER